MELNGRGGAPPVILGRGERLLSVLSSRSRTERDRLLVADQRPTAELDNLLGCAPHANGITRPSAVVRLLDTSMPAFGVLQTVTPGLGAGNIRAGMSGPRCNRNLFSRATRETGSFRRPLTSVSEAIAAIAQLNKLAIRMDYAVLAGCARIHVVVLARPLNNRDLVRERCHPKLNARSRAMPPLPHALLLAP